MSRDEEERQSESENENERGSEGEKSEKRCRSNGFSFFLFLTNEEFTKKRDFATFLCHFKCKPFGVLMKILKLIALISLTFPTLMLAEDQRVPIGTRPISEEAAAEIEAQKGKKEEAEGEEEEEGPLETAGYIFDRYPPIYYSGSHHWLTLVTVLDNNEYTLELEDGSVWKISSYDGNKVLNWRTNDPLTLTQNNRWFTRFDYRIINKANHSSVEANLFLGPIELGEHSKFIIGIDHARREIMLSDNTHWEISYLDSSIFKDWALNDYIILGTNSNTSIWDSGSDALLINVNMNTGARGKQF